MPLDHLVAVRGPEEPNSFNTLLEMPDYKCGVIYLQKFMTFNTLLEMPMW